ncbi:hypothetical protein EJD97_015704 [Solanum chilense]|uniref:X8 domain-containing protein n=1 Tax=Solanum chilense TaxID=4083 RepID=A0A6N2CFG0_SOLCI|nr:hypothetical protein EJD97_015704 [Solanum chilense]
MAKPPPFHLLIIIINFSILNHVKATWCVARSDASEESLQNALDYACFSGADCAPVLENGLCYLPNTIQAHASYAFNGFYQRMNRAPGSCDFAGTATIAKTDPSYGSCVYPATPSTAGGSTTTTPSTPGGGTGGATTTTPILFPPPPPGTALPLNSNGGTTPRGRGIPETSNGSYNKLSNLVHVAISMLLLLLVFQLL